MKVLSKYKDFYDYLVGTYGHDPLVVYDRRDGVVTKPNYEGNGMGLYPYDKVTSPDEKTFYICGTKYTLYYYKNNVYHTIDELVELHKLLLKDGNNPILDNYSWKGVEGSAKRYYKRYNGKTNVNDEQEQPVLVIDQGGYHNGREYVDATYHLVNLAPYKLARYIPADKMFQDVYSFLSKLKDEVIPNNQSDIEKVVSHGFDKKISFRHRK